MTEKIVLDKPQVEFLEAFDADCKAMILGYSSALSDAKALIVKYLAAQAKAAQKEGPNGNSTPTDS